MTRPEVTITTVCELRTEKIEERIITARLVPYGETSYLVPDAGGERFMRGSLTKTMSEWAAGARKLKLFRAHQHHEAVGLATLLDPDAPGGPLAEFRIATTHAGESVLDEVRQGLLDAVSVGFHATRERRGRDGVREITEARLLEVSVAPMAAYDGAEILAMRAAHVRVVDLTKYQLPVIPRYDADAPLWSGLR
jgi:HK97 family phage prohead protease